MKALSMVGVLAVATASPVAAYVFTGNMDVFGGTLVVSMLLGFVALFAIIVEG